MDDLAWENIKEKHQVGTFIRGKVVQHMHFGIFLDIGEPEVKGLIRIVDFVDEGDEGRSVSSNRLDCGRSNLWIWRTRETD
jgi:ribosomal protein S1